MNFLMKKEIKEQIRTYKAFIMIIIFVFLGILSPFSARYMNEIFSLIGGDMITINFDPSINEVFTQLNKNLLQFGIIIFVLLNYDMLTFEIEKEYLVIPKSKGLSLIKLAIAKNCVIFVTFMFAITLSFISCAIYTQLLFSQFEIDIYVELWMLYMLVGLFMLSLITLANTLVKTRWATLLILIALLVVNYILYIISPLDITYPFALFTINVDVILSGQKSILEMYNYPQLITYIIVIYVISILILKKKKLS